MILPLEGPYASNADEKLRQKLNEVIWAVNLINQMVEDLREE